MRKQDKRHRKVRKCIHGPHSLGQHLLHSKKLVRELIRNFGIGSRDTVLDIGAGKGALTLPLAEKAGDVWAVELDPGFAQALRKKTENCRNVRVIQGDFLNCRLPARPFCVVSSIPYAITTPIMEKLLAPASSGLQRAVIVMEKGAAKRFTGVPVTDPRILSWRMWFELQMGKTISRYHFSPPPGVESAVLFIRRKQDPVVSQRNYFLFRALAEHGLKHPQLPLSEAFKGIFTAPQIARLAREAGVTRDTPVLALNERQWGIVFHTMMRYVEPARWPSRRK